MSILKLVLALLNNKTHAAHRFKHTKITVMWNPPTGTFKGFWIGPNRKGPGEHVVLSAGPGVQRPEIPSERESPSTLILHVNALPSCFYFFLRKEPRAFIKFLKESLTKI